MDVDALYEALADAGVPGGDADMVAAGAYAAAELAWSLEELTQVCVRGKGEQSACSSGQNLAHAIATA
jgi:hypothetical protein